MKKNKGKYFNYIKEDFPLYHGRRFYLETYALMCTEYDTKTQIMIATYFNDSTVLSIC